MEGAAHTTLMMRQVEKRVKDLEKQLKAAVLAANEAEAKLQREKVRSLPAPVPCVLLVPVFSMSSPLLSN